MEAIHTLDELPLSDTSSIEVNEWRQKCYDAMNDDFNSPVLIAHLFEAVKNINTIKEGKASITKADLETLKNTLHEFAFDVLGLSQQTEQQNNNEKLENVVDLLINMRNEARANKNFSLSDEIRDKLLAIGIQLKDGKEGTTFQL